MSDLNIPESRCYPRKLGVGSIILIYSILACLFSVYVGMFQFGGYDLSLLIDLQSRIARNDIPGVDYFHTLPFSLTLILKLYGIFFAPSWVSLFVVNAVVFLSATLVVCFFWPPGIQSDKKLLAVFALSLPLLYTNHIWHSSLSQFFAVSYLVLSLSFFRAQRRRYSLLFLLALFAGLLFYSKQNIGLPLILLVSVLLMALAWTEKNKRAEIALFLSLNLSGILLITAVLRLAFDMPFESLLNSFLMVLGRTKISAEQIDAVLIKPEAVISLAGLIACFVLAKRWCPSLRLPDGWAVILSGASLAAAFYLAILIGLNQGIGPYDIFLAFAVTALAVAFMNGYQNSDGGAVEYGLLFSALAVSALPMLTDWDTKYNNASLPILCFILMTDFSREAARKIASGAVVLAAISAAIGGYVRQRMHDVGPFWENAPLSPVVSGYFEGLYAGPLFHQARAEMAKALAGRTDEKVFCGPRIEFCYMDRHLASPHGLPIWWHAGSSYPVWAEAKVIEAFRAQRYAVLIFLRGDRTRMPQEILSYIQSAYTLQSGFDMLDIYKLNKEIAP